MVCIYCGGRTSVINSRSRLNGLQIWRRRRCAECEAIFTTLESVQGEQALMVQLSKGFEPFLRDKLLLSVYDSLKHRKTAVRDATALTDTILVQLFPLFERGTIAKSQISQLAHPILKRFDEVAAVHYRAFHHS